MPKRRALTPHSSVSQRTTIVNVGYRSTNYWVVSGAGGRLLVDIGWPGSLGQMKAELKRMRVPLNEIAYALATHYHIDHAGLGEELKSEGVRLLVIDQQVHAIGEMMQWAKPADNYVEITPGGNRVISCDESRALLATLGIGGQILPTPGHSDHCVSLVLDTGEAFTGDLPAPWMSGGDAQVRASWDRLIEAGAKQVLPGHGPIVPVQRAW